MYLQSRSLRREAGPAERPARILVVDDDPGIRALCEAVLTPAGYDVIEAADGREGLERALADDPDLMLLDIKMPLLDGFGLAAALRADERTRDLPFVFVTGEAAPDVEGHAQTSGALGYFAKPFEPEALADLVRRLLARLDRPPRPSY